MNCSCCSAPLPVEGVVCAYCGSRQDVDLQGWARLESCGMRPELRCPDGHGPLEDLRLGAERSINLSRCPTCLGLFAQRASFERLLSEAVGPVWQVDRALLEQLVENPRQAATSFRYRPCPECGDIMNRRLFGKRSGVIIDRCRSHGSWLDAGELRQLLEWVRAGGRIHHGQRMEEEEAERQAAARRLRQSATPATLGIPPVEPYRDEDLLQLLARGLRGLLR